MMKLYGGPISPFVRKVRICLIEKGIDAAVEHVRSPTAMIRANSDLMRINPLSKIPTLVTGDGNQLFDSDVICEVIDDRFPIPNLFPKMGDARWKTLVLNALASGTLDALVLWRFERNRPAPQQSQEVLTAYQAKIGATLAHIEAQMALISETAFDIGQISLGCAFGYLDFRFHDIDWRSTAPNSAAWFESFSARPSALKTLPYEGTPPTSVEATLWK